MRNKAIIFGAIAACIFSISCKKEDKTDSTEISPVRVKTMCVAAADVSSSRAYSGTVEASSGTSVSFPVSGTISRIYVSEGDRVGKGQLIATLDQTSLRNAYEIAKSALDEAQDAYDRMKMLHDSNSLPDMQWVQVQNTLKQAQSAEAIAKKTLNDANLYSPASGYVSEKFVESGMTVAPIEPIIKVVNINPVKVNISLPENEISAISTGQKAYITMSSADTAAFTGIVTEKGVSANPISRAYDVKITVQNPSGRLLPGMICDVALEKATPVKTIILPIQSVLLDADNANFVWAARGGKAAKQIVKVGGITDTGIIIDSGIAAGDSVIIDGMQKVSQGSPIVTVK